ncbi:hypothetical protein PENTCL1PPCAC_17767, partial [Pristionchus entomophagus]
LGILPLSSTTKQTNKSTNDEYIIPTTSVSLLLCCELLLFRFLRTHIFRELSFLFCTHPRRIIAVRLLHCLHVQRTLLSSLHLFLSGFRRLFSHSSILLSIVVSQFGHNSGQHLVSLRLILLSFDSSHLSLELGTK